jgi:hypothetical protein
MFVATSTPLSPTYYVLLRILYDEFVIETRAIYWQVIDLNYHNFLLYFYCVYFLLNIFEETQIRRTEIIIWFTRLEKSSGRNRQKPSSTICIPLRT